MLYGTKQSKRVCEKKPHSSSPQCLPLWLCAMGTLRETLAALAIIWVGEAVASRLNPFRPLKGKPGQNSRFIAETVLKGKILYLALVSPLGDGRGGLLKL